MIEYVPMEKAHIDGLVEIEEQCFNSGYAKKTFEKELENKIAYYLVAKTDDKILGYIGIWNICGIAEIIDIAVLKTARRQGIARKLLEKVFDFCLRQDISEINLEVRKSNTSARRLYEKTGFFETGIRKKYYENTEDAVLMTKNIDLEGRV